MEYFAALFFSLKNQCVMLLKSFFYMFLHIFFDDIMIFFIFLPH